MTHPEAHIVIIELTREGTRLGWNMEEILVSYRVFLHISDLLLKALEMEEISWSRAIAIVDEANLSQFYTSIPSFQRAEAARVVYRQTLSDIQTLLESLRQFILNDLPTKYTHAVLQVQPTQIKMLPDKEDALALLDRLSTHLEVGISNPVRALLEIVDTEQMYTVSPDRTKNEITQIGHRIHRAVREERLSVAEGETLLKPLIRLGRSMKFRQGLIKGGMHA